MIGTPLVFAAFPVVIGGWGVSKANPPLVRQALALHQGIHLPERGFQAAGGRENGR